MVHGMVVTMWEGVFAHEDILGSAHGRTRIGVKETSMHVKRCVSYVFCFSVVLLPVSLLYVFLGHLFSLFPCFSVFLVFLVSCVHGRHVPLFPCVLVFRVSLFALFSCFQGFQFSSFPVSRYSFFPLFPRSFVSLF